MSRICEICGKKPLSGNNRSHSNRASKRRFGVNIQKIRYRLNGKTHKGYVCADCLKKVEKIA